MSWVRFDDAMGDHPKFLAMGPLAPLALALQVRACLYVARHLTDGYVPAGALAGLLQGFDAWSIETGTIGDPPIAGFGESADALNWPELMIRAGLWEHAKRRDGYVIHDYLEYNPARESVLAARESNAARQKNFRGRNGKRNGATNGPNNGPVTTPPAPSPLKALAPVVSSLIPAAAQNSSPQAGKSTTRRVGDILPGVVAGIEARARG